jgi:hypothetical protein
LTLASRGLAEGRITPAAGIIDPVEFAAKTRILM